MSEYGEPNTFFAFIESIYDLPKRENSEEGPEKYFYHSIIEKRNKNGLPPASHAIWLDCINAPYFKDQPWISSTMREDDESDRQRRIEDIQSLEEAYFLVILILLSDKNQDELKQLNQYRDTHWHKIEISQETGSIAFTGQNYEAVDFDSTYSVENLELADGDRWLLYNVFNVDFIKEIDRGDPLMNDPSPQQLPTLGREIDKEEQESNLVEVIEAVKEQEAEPDGLIGEQQIQAHGEE